MFPLQKHVRRENHITSASLDDRYVSHAGDREQLNLLTAVYQQPHNAREGEDQEEKEDGAAGKGGGRTSRRGGEVYGDKVGR